MFTNDSSILFTNDQPIIYQRLQPIVYQPLRPIVYQRPAYCLPTTPADCLPYVNMAYCLRTITYLTTHLVMKRWEHWTPTGVESKDYSHACVCHHVEKLSSKNSTTSDCFRFNKDLI